MCVGLSLPINCRALHPVVIFLVDYIGAGDTAAIFGEMHGSENFVESAREFIGLLITLIALVINIRQVGQKT